MNFYDELIKSKVNNREEVLVLIKMQMFMYSDELAKKNTRVF